MPSASNSLVERTRNRFRSRPLQAATGALALLAITYSIYTWSISGSDRGGNNGRGGSTSQGSNDEAGNSSGNAGETSGKESKVSRDESGKKELKVGVAAKALNRFEFESYP